MATVRLRLVDDNRLEASVDEGEFQSVLICSLHKVSSHIPYKEDWEDERQRDELSAWLVLPPIDVEGSDFPEELKAQIGSVQRPNEPQATFNDYQLYYYQGDAGDGTAPGFWEVATLDRMQEKPRDEKCPDQPTDPRISRGP